METIIISNNRFNPESKARETINEAANCNILQKYNKLISDKDGYETYRKFLTIYIEYDVYEKFIQPFKLSDISIEYDSDNFYVKKSIVETDFDDNGCGCSLTLVER